MLPSSTFVHYKKEHLCGSNFCLFWVQTALNSERNWPCVMVLRSLLNTFGWRRLVSVKLDDQLQFGRCEFRHYRQKHKQTEKEMLMDKWPKCEGSKKHIKTLVKHREGMASVKLVPLLRKAPRQVESTTFDTEAAYRKQTSSTPVLPKQIN